MAIGLVTELLRAGLEVPRDMSIVGYDDISIASEGPIALTTVRQPKRDIGRIGFELLLE